MDAVPLVWLLPSGSWFWLKKQDTVRPLVIASAVTLPLRCAHPCSLCLCSSLSWRVESWVSGSLCRHNQTRFPDVNVTIYLRWISYSDLHFLYRFRLFHIHSSNRTWQVPFIFNQSTNTEQWFIWINWYKWIFVFSPEANPLPVMGYLPPQPPVDHRCICKMLQPNPSLIRQGPTSSHTLNLSLCLGLLGNFFLTFCMKQTDKSEQRCSCFLCFGHRVWDRWLLSNRDQAGPCEWKFYPL